MADRPSDERRIVRLRFASHPDLFVLARLVLTGIAVAEGLSSQVVSDLKLAVTEACSNAIQHAAANSTRLGIDGSGHEISVSYLIDPGLITIAVADSNAGVEPIALHTVARDPADHSDETSLSVIESLVDDLSFVSDRTGSRVTFKKRFEVQPAT